ncbi:hypothetical protein ACMYYO_03560 [Dermacoccaceae bacterium W4C1]
MELTFQLLFTAAAVIMVVGVAWLAVGMMRGGAADADAEPTMRDWGTGATLTGATMVIASIVSGRYDTLLLKDALFAVIIFGAATATLMAASERLRRSWVSKPIAVLALVLPIIGGFFAAWGASTLS